MTLADYLSHSGRSSEEFARAIGVDAVTVNRYLNGRRRPRWDILDVIKAETGGSVTADDFLKPTARRIGPRRAA